MSKIQYQNTSIEITNDGGFSSDSKRIRYTLSSDLIDGELMQSLFTDKQFILQNGKLTFSDAVSVASMDSIITETLIEQSDVNKTVKEAIMSLSVNIIYDLNLLNINKDNWTLNE